MGNSGTFQPGPDPRRGRGPRPGGGKRAAERQIRAALADLTREKRGWTVESAQRLVNATLRVYDLVIETAEKMLQRDDAKGAADILRAAPQADIPQVLAWMASYSDGKPPERASEAEEDEPVDPAELERKLNLVPGGAAKGTT